MSAPARIISLYLIMKKHVLIFLVSIISATSSSQTIESLFMENLKNRYNNNLNKFEEKVLSTDINININELNVSFIYIPTVFAKKKVIKGDLSKEFFFHYLNANNVQFEEAIIYKDSVLLGTIAQCSTNDCEVYYLDKDHPFSLFMTPFFNKIKEINPLIIFRAYNIYNTYWFIKNNKLYTLTFNNENNKMVDFKIYDAKEYIQKYLNDDDMYFLNHKREKIMCK